MLNSHLQVEKKMFIKLESYEVFLTCYCFFNRIKRGKVENTKVKLFKHLEPPPRPRVWVSLYLQALKIKKDRLKIRMFKPEFQKILL